MALAGKGGDGAGRMTILREPYIHDRPLHADPDDPKRIAPAAARVREYF